MEFVQFHIPITIHQMTHVRFSTRHIRYDFESTKPPKHFQDHTNHVQTLEHPDKLTDDQYGSDQQMEDRSITNCITNQ